MLKQVLVVEGKSDIQRVQQALRWSVLPRKGLTCASLC